MPRVAKVTMAADHLRQQADPMSMKTYRFATDRLLLVGATVAFWAVVVTALRLLAF